MSAQTECPMCGSWVEVDLKDLGAELCCGECGEFFDLEPAELERIKTEQEKDIDDLIEIDLAVDGDLNGDLDGDLFG